MLLFLNHPYYQNEEEALEFIPSALEMLRNLEGAALFPHPICGASRATLDHETIVPDESMQVGRCIRDPMSSKES